VYANATQAFAVACRHRNPTTAILVRMSEVRIFNGLEAARTVRVWKAPTQAVQSRIEHLGWYTALSRPQSTALSPKRAIPVRLRLRCTMIGWNSYPSVVNLAAELRAPARSPGRCRDRSRGLPAPGRWTLVARTRPYARIVLRRTSSSWSSGTASASTRPPDAAPAASEKRPDKTFIGCIVRGFDFLGYHFGPEGLSVAKATLGKFVERAARLYEQGPGEPEGSRRLGR
jgi:hypothetical protein